MHVVRTMARNKMRKLYFTAGRKMQIINWHRSNQITSIIRFVLQLAITVYYYFIDLQVLILMLLLVIECARKSFYTLVICILFLFYFSSFEFAFDSFFLLIKITKWEHFGLASCKCNCFDLLFDRRTATLSAHHFLLALIYTRKMFAKRERTSERGRETYWMG